MIQIPVTIIGLVGYYAFPNIKLLRNLVIANSVVGIIYMHAEYKALHDRGSVIVGVPVRVSTTPMHILIFIPWDSSVAFLYRIH